ncbi:MAG: EscU/YscU/HrcU family type III secretion system export apparatus switch protein [Acidobacteriota bacterium]
MADADRTEEATPHKRAKAREKGQIARSRELPTALALTAIVMVLDWYAKTFLFEWRAFFAQTLAMAHSSSFGNFLYMMQTTTRVTAYWVVPCLVLGVVLSVAGNVGQGGVVFATEALTPDFARMSPSANLKKIFSIGGLGNLLKSLIPMAVIAYLAFAMVVRDWHWIVLSSGVSARASIVWLMSRAYEISWKSGMVFLGWSAFDYLFQRTQLSRQLRMSRQEIIQENKDTIGNPQIKMRIRKLQRQMRRRMMMRDVAKAAVVITNPTEYAIALRYEPGAMPAPVVVAKGRNLLARQIRREAVWHNVPIVENRPLAHALYRAVQVGQAIPPALYLAVAEILAFIFRAQSASRTARREGPKAGNAQRSRP